MAEIRWTLKAADDIEAIVEYIARDSEHYASLFAFNIVSAIERLAISPNADVSYQKLIKKIFVRYFSADIALFTDYGGK